MRTCGWAVVGSSWLGQGVSGKGYKATCQDDGDSFFYLDRGLGYRDVHIYWPKLSSHTLKI